MVGRCSAVVILVVIFVVVVGQAYVFHGGWGDGGI